MRTEAVLFGLLTFVVLVGVPARAADKVDARNPFGVADVQDPDGEDVKAFAAKTKLSGDKTDPNAEQWVNKASAGRRGSIDGEWYERWNNNGGQTWSLGKDVTKIKPVGDRVYMLVRASTGQYLIDLKRDGKRLTGRYTNVDRVNDSGPCVFEIVSDERIDGAWGSGRWDFRRKLHPLE